MSSSRDGSSFSLSLAPSNLIFATYRHFPYTLGEALAELVDNSTQSFLDHRHEMRQSRVDVSVNYVRNAGASSIVVRDDAYGMSEIDLRRALRLAEPPPTTTGRCEFGMGLKTSCCWLGDTWTIRTKQQGQRFEYVAVFDVTKITESPVARIQVKQYARAKSEHYTEIVIGKLNRDYHTRTISKAKQLLAQAYQRDLRKRTLRLSYNSDVLTASETELMSERGRQVRTTFSFRVGPHKINGWVGLLAQGKGSSAAGFDIFRRGRLIVPHFKFVGPGLYPEVRTNVIHQRLVGSIDLDTIPVVHLKNGIDLRNFQEEFETKLASAIQEMRGRAIALRYHDLVETTALLHPQSTRGNPALGHSPETIHVSDSSLLREPTVEIGRGDAPARDIGRRTFARHNMRLFLAPAGKHEPYVRFENGDEIRVLVNTLHPKFQDLDGFEFEAFLDEIVRDVTTQIRVGAQETTWIDAKDYLLRAHASDGQKGGTGSETIDLQSAS